MFTKILLAACCSMVAFSASAVDASKVDKSIELKNGTTVYLFKDGKMGMEGKGGAAVGMKSGEVMEGKDGQRYIMIGNEVARLDWLMKQDNKAQ